MAEASPVPRIPAVANPGAAEVVYFDWPLAYVYTGGMGSITLTTSRQLVDTTGAPYEDRVVTGLLKAPLATLQQLRAVIEDIERRAQDEVAAVVALVTKPKDAATH